jgi:hypothetical protein
MKINDMVKVDWVDSNSRHGWEQEDIYENSVAPCRTVGILKENHRNFVAIAQSDSSLGSKMNNITIPRGCIVRIRKLRLD